MDLTGTSVVVTGGGNGIGLALARRFAQAGARGIVVADLNAGWAESAADLLLANGTPAVGLACDVGDPDAIGRLVSTAEEAHGPIDVFCSNAGYSDPAPGTLDESVPADAWRRIVDVNLLAHVWAAERVVPGMAERGKGYLLQTISSAALITGPSAPGYTLSKHGALGFAEWVTLNYGHRGVRVSCLCPNAVYTGMFGRAPDDEDTDTTIDVPGLGEVLTPESVADTTVTAMEGAEPFLVLPHERVAASFLRKATDYDGWIARTRSRLVGTNDGNGTGAL
ncbi:dehydrogenase (plasmid) [Rhodococcus jostii RHA1]|jgi:NAD(P)-dependent dehydrogenase (short-subunit alcohol dehydrogenase family)|uniref:Dehydrogenase n=1 Tax=Rhodococcus jostii (strain RHA1) TaxID=101510 RepID=Q0RVZ1_RHOJR|nr:SDR family oxidoreductase [Rhodococcus jostii]ABH00545.1 dehydrogenase [Rhodococcus jostii RHA1]